jgi:nucleotide-binding universal stress UspA family protein
VSVTYSHIACFIDDSEAASRALAHAAALRDGTGARLSVVHVLAPPASLSTPPAGPGAAPVHDTEVEKEAAEMWLAEEARSVGAEGILLEGHPASTATEWAEQNGVDIVMAATHRGLVERALLGSFAGYLAHHAPCAVFLIPPEQGDS